MTKSTFVRLIQAKTALTVEKSGVALDAILNIITEELKAGEGRTASRTWEARSEKSGGKESAQPAHRRDPNNSSAEGCCLSQRQTAQGSSEQTGIVVFCRCRLFPRLCGRRKILTSLST